MTANKNLLIGKWRFIKAEQHNGSEWEPISHTNGMSWEFYPEYISETKSIGVIVETAPLVDEVRLNYTFSDRDNLLRIELYTDPQTRIKDETDIYSLSEITQTATQSTIVLSLINCLSCPHHTCATLCNLILGNVLLDNGGACNMHSRGCYPRPPEAIRNYFSCVCHGN